MSEKPKPDLSAELHLTLNNACQKWGAREIRLRYLPKPSLNQWIAEALIDHHRVVEKIRADMPDGELTLHDMETLHAGSVVPLAMRLKPCHPCNGERREMGKGNFVSEED